MATTITVTATITDRRTKIISSKFVRLAVQIGCKDRLLSRPAHWRGELVEMLAKLVSLDMRRTSSRDQYELCDIPRGEPNRFDQGVTAPKFVRAGGLTIVCRRL
jgi:hypothetical protein